MLSLISRVNSVPFQFVFTRKSCFFFKCDKQSSLVGFELGSLLKYHIYYRCFGLNYLMASATSETFK